MKNEGQLHVKVENCGSELTIIEGNALPIKEPIIVSISGMIKAPSDFYVDRKELFETEKEGLMKTAPINYDYDSTFLTIDKINGVVVLVIDENNPYRTTITGKLKENPAIKDLGINVDNTVLEPKDLARKIRKYRHYATEPLKFNEVLKALENFKGEFNTQFEASNDRKGGVANSIVKKLISEHSLDFSLVLPLWYETKLVTLNLITEIDYNSNTLVCSLYCPELETIVENMKEEIFDEIAKTFELVTTIII